MKRWCGILMLLCACMGCTSDKAKKDKEAAKEAAAGDPIENAVAEMTRVAEAFELTECAQVAEKVNAIDPTALVKVMMSLRAKHGDAMDEGGNEALMPVRKAFKRVMKAQAGADQRCKDDAAYKAISEEQQERLLKAMMVGYIPRKRDKDVPKVTFCGEEHRADDERVYCSTKDIVEDLAPVAQLTAMDTLEIRVGAKTDLTPLTKHPTLKTLSLHVPDEEAVNFSALASSETLDELTLHFKKPVPAALAGLQTLKTFKAGLKVQVTGGSKISDLSALAGLTPVQEIRISWSATEITDLSPLKDLKNLQSLRIPGSKVTDLSALAGLTALTKLELREAPAQDLTPLRGLTALEHLSLNHIGADQAVDVTPLAGLTNLKYLDLGGVTGITNIAPLATLTNLETLRIFRTKITDISAIAGMTKLQTLEMGSVEGVTDASSIKGLSALKTLDIGGTGIVDLKPLAGLTALEELKIGAGFIINVAEHRMDLAPLATLTALKNLEISHTTLPDTTPLASLSKLDNLSAMTVVIESFPKATLPTSLRRVMFSRVTLPSGDMTPFANLSKLTRLTLGTVKPTPDVSALTGLTNLKQLVLNKSNVTDISALKPLVDKGLEVSGVEAAK